MKKHKVKRPSQRLLHSPFAILRDIVSALTIPGIVPKTSFYVQWRWKWGNSLFQKEHPRSNPTSFLLRAAIYQTLRYQAYHGALTQRKFYSMTNEKAVSPVWWIVALGSLSTCLHHISQLNFKTLRSLKAEGPNQNAAQWRILTMPSKKVITIYKFYAHDL